MYFQDLVMKFYQFWGEYGCLLYYPSDCEVGAGTFNPATFLRVLGEEPWKVAYLEPSHRPTDGRYGENPNRTELHHQFQVILKPSPDDIQDVYIESLRYVGIDPRLHDIKFTEDDWESPTLGATGLGWQVELDGMEITQFTYFQQMGGIELYPVSVEITYGLDRIAMILQGVDSFFDLMWCEGVSYAEIRREAERQFSIYNFDEADVELHLKLFSMYEAECKRLLEQELVLVAYTFLLKCSHTFNILDARGALSVTERAHYIARIRALARGCAEAYLRMLQHAKGEVKT